ncbi:MAG: hypothetical protein K6A78_02200 [Prevotella sp.]|nr:hypothetical protein [Prevotella sp.]
MITRLTRHFYQRTAVMLAVMLMTMTAWAQTELFSGGDGTVDNPYKITTADDLNKLAADVNSGTKYTDTYFKLMNDVCYEHTSTWNDTTSTENNFTPIGNSSKSFRGTFDGNNKSISGIRIYKNTKDANSQYIGLFGTLKGTVKNLTLTDTRIVAYGFTGGIAATCSSNSVIDHCIVTSTVAVYSVQHGGLRLGGITGYANINTAIISNNISSATVAIKDSLGGCEGYGGILGGAAPGATVSNNLAIGAKVKDSSGRAGAIMGYSNIDANLSNNYYIDCTVNGTANAVNVGCHAADITDNDAAVSIHTLTLTNGITTTTAPSVNISGTDYYAHGTLLKLNPNQPAAPAGYTYPLIVNGTSMIIDGDTLVMPAANTTIGLDTDLALIPWTGSGTETDPYVIKYTSQLDQLADNVNDGNAYKDTYFQLGADLAYDHNTAWDDTTSIENNYTPIGYYISTNSARNHPFRGHFDGKDHTISGIRIYADGSNTGVDDNKGIFGCISKNAVVTGITLNDARIVGYSRVGGIVGCNDGETSYYGNTIYYGETSYDNDTIYNNSPQGGTITNCVVTDSVAIHIVQPNFFYGGIVGCNSGTVTHCVSSVQMSAAAGITPKYCGGIAGSNYNQTIITQAIATLEDNLVVGAVIPYAASSGGYKFYGAIASEIGSTTLGRASYARNYYYGCTVAGVENATGVGIAQNTGKTTIVTDITDNDGAVPGYLLTLPDSISAKPVITHNDRNFCGQGTTITLTGMQTDTPPVGYTYEGYIVNDKVISGSAFTMPAQNTTVTSAIVSVYPLILEDGISATTAPAITFDGTPYYKEGTTITLAGQPDAENGDIKPYTVNDSIIYGDKFVMPAVNVTVGFGALTDWQRVYAGTVADPYKIYTTAQLDLLAQRVNSGAYSYEGKYFLLMNDLCYEHTSAWNATTSTENNYTAIGCSFNDGTSHYYNFCGHFLGDGHTISGIRIYKKYYYQGLFGILGEGAEVSGVTLTDTRISAYGNTGGIVGRNFFGSVTDCHVESDVTLLSLNSNAIYFGGIVANNSNGTITDCTSAVTIMLTSNVSSSNFGSIVGLNSNGTITNCRAIGAIVPTGISAGAVVGYNRSGTVSNNTYHSCLVGTNAFNIGIGRYDADDIYFTGGSDLSGKAELDNTALHLFDNRDNTALIDAYANPSEHTANGGSAPNVSNIAVTLRGRTLYKDGSWNTICLPFDVNIAGSVLDGAVARKLTATSITGDETTGQTLNLTFADAGSELQAGVPYIIKWEEGDNIIDPVFTGKAISPTEPTTVTSQDGMVSFIGTYGTVSLAANDKSNIYFGSANKLFWPDQNVTVGAFRAYFKINETAAVNAKGITGFVIDFGENDEEATGINEAAADSSLFTPHSSLSEWYTVDGIRLNGKPSKKGMYIHNGKKVVVE